MESFAAIYNDGVSARTLNVQVNLTPEGLSIFDESNQSLASWPAEAIRIVDPKSARGSLRLAKAEHDLARLTITDDNLRTIILDTFPHASRRHRVNKALTLRVLSWLAAAVAGIALLIWVILPFVAERVSTAVPLSWQTSVGEKVKQEIIQLVSLMESKPVEALTCKNEAGLTAVTKMTKLLTARAHPDILLRVRVIDSGLVNALALPGGRIILTRGIIDFVSGPNELAGVLAHEIGHAKMNHSLKRMIEVGGVTALFSFLVGDVAGGAIVIAVGQALISGQYSQAAEREADQYSVQLLGNAKIDSRPFARLFERLESKKLVPKSGTQRGVWSWVGSHPPSIERAKAIRRAAQPGGEILSQAEWQSLKSVCKK